MWTYQVPADSDLFCFVLLKQNLFHDIFQKDKCMSNLMQLFAQVQIVEEDTKTLGYFSRHLNTAFGSLASSFNRKNGREKQYSTGLLPQYNDRKSHVSSLDEFVEEPEDEEQFGQHQEAFIRLVLHNC